MRGQAVLLAVALAGLASPAAAQPEATENEPRTAEQFIETAREVRARSPMSGRSGATSRPTR